MFATSSRQFRTTIAPSLLVALLTCAASLPAQVQSPEVFTASAPGLISGEGTFFAVTESAYLDVSLASTEPVAVILRSVPNTITVELFPKTEVANTLLTLSGLEPSAIYHLYRDSYQNGTTFAADADGTYSFEQDISQRHFLFVQTVSGTKFLRDDATGGDCTGIGTWNSASKTCTLTGTVGEAIQVEGDGITLDGAGHLLTGPGSGHGVYIWSADGVTVKNLTITRFTAGILVGQSRDAVLQFNTLDRNQEGIVLYWDTNSTVTNNRITAGPSESGIRTSWTNYPSGLLPTDRDIIRDNLVLGGTLGFYLMYADRVVFERNLLTGNRDGIRTVYNGSFGERSFQISQNNISGYANYAVYFEPYGRIDLSMPFNWFGTASQAAIDLAVFDQHDDGVLGKLSYCPWLLQPAPTSNSSLSIDADGDNWNVCDDCDDHNYLVHPGIDADGDGDSVCADCDDLDEILNLADVDADSVTSCAGDCDDHDAAKFPPYDDLVINQDTTFACTGVYDLVDAGQSGVLLVTGNNLTLDCNGATLRFPHVGRSGFGIRLGNWLENVSIENCTLENYVIGIDASYSSGLTLRGNTLRNIQYGVRPGDYALVEDNSFFDNELGLEYWTGMAGVIRNNLFHGGAGIGLSNQRNNVFESNIFQDVTMAIAIGGSITDGTVFADNVISTTGVGNSAIIFTASGSNNVFRGNTITGNFRTGIGASSATGANNLFVGNDITGAGRAIELGTNARYLTFGENTIAASTRFGVWLSRNASDNRFYNNNFFGNAIQAYVEGGSSNRFFELPPVGGNYWSDWTSPDANRDGFVDAPYLFTGGRDDYPLVCPFGQGGADDIPPVTAATLAGTSGTGGWYTSDVTVTLDATDQGGTCGGGGAVASTEYSLDGVTFSLYGLPLVVSTEGTTTVYYRSVDTADNIEATQSVTVKVDTLSPQITVLRPTAYGVYAVGPALEWTITDANLTESHASLADAEGVVIEVLSGFVPGPGVYTLEITAEDAAGHQSSAGPIFFVVYDPAGGFATGGGWFLTDAESTLPGGRANFGFNAKYRNASAAGNLEFQYQSANLNLKSRTLDWLTLSASSAQFQGTATINGAGLFTFRVTAKDRGEPGAGVDHFDIRIWYGTDTSGEPLHKAKNLLGGGNIVVHKPNGGK